MITDIGVTQLEGEGEKVKGNIRHFSPRKDTSFKPHAMKLSYKQASRKLQLHTTLL
jgi:hypothetical protein